MQVLDFFFFTPREAFFSGVGKLAGFITPVGTVLDVFLTEE